MRYQAVLIILLVVGSNGLGQRVSTANSQSDAKESDFPTIPKAVRETTFRTVDGKPFRLSDFSNKVMVINIWATWCGPCHLEMPRLSQMYKEYKSRGVVILGLATTYNESNDAKHVKNYLRKLKIKYKSIWDDGTLAVSLVESVHGRAVIPQTFVIAKDGRVVKHFMGFNSTITPKLEREAIEQALKSSPKPPVRASKSLDAGVKSSPARYRRWY